MHVALMSNQADKIDAVYHQAARERLAAQASLLPGIIGSDSFQSRATELYDVEAIFGTWGMPLLTDEQMELLPNLHIVFYAASSIRRFAEPFLERGITVCSAWSANAVPVAEFALSQILLSLKGYFHNSRDYALHQGQNLHKGPGAYGETVALLGYGQVARHLRRFLLNHKLKVLVVDPYVSAEEALNEQIELVDMHEAFARAHVVSNHLPNLKTTQGIINAEVLAGMPAHASFINTGRGASVDEAELIRHLQTRPDIMALLDVTFPEPPTPDSSLYTLPNVRLSRHIAGSINDECHRMADWMLEEFEIWRQGGQLRFAIDKERLAIMA